MAWWLQGLVSLGCALPGGCHRDSPSQVLVTLYPWGDSWGVLGPKRLCRRWTGPDSL